jgi:hypothetical protein
MAFAECGQFGARAVPTLVIDLSQANNSIVDYITIQHTVFRPIRVTGFQELRRRQNSRVCIVFLQAYQPIRAQAWVYPPRFMPRKAKVSALSLRREPSAPSSFHLGTAISDTTSASVVRIRHTRIDSRCEIKSGRTKFWHLTHEKPAFGVFRARPGRFAPSKHVARTIRTCPSPPNSMEY